jgi:hypothetical protein
MAISVYFFATPSQNRSIGPVKASGRSSGKKQSGARNFDHSFCAGMVSFNP